MLHRLRDLAGQQAAFQQVARGRGRLVENKLVVRKGFAVLHPDYRSSGIYGWDVLVAMREAILTAAQGYIVTIGIQPTHASTGSPFFWAGFQRRVRAMSRASPRAIDGCLVRNHA